MKKKFGRRPDRPDRPDRKERPQHPAKPGHYDKNKFFDKKRRLEKARRVGGHGAPRPSDDAAAPDDERPRNAETRWLGGFEAVRPKIEEYMNRTRDYATNKYRLAPEQKAEVTRRWGDTIRLWGYAEPEE